MTFEATLLVQDPADDRAHLRRKLGLGARVRAFGGRPIDVTVLEITPRGFAAQVAEPLAIGQEVWLTLEEGEPIAARLMWQADGRIGARFTANDPAAAEGGPLPGDLERGFGITIDRAKPTRWYLPRVKPPPGATPAQARRHILIVGFVIGWALTLLLVALLRAG